MDCSEIFIKMCDHPLIQEFPITHDVASFHYMEDTTLHCKEHGQMAMNNTIYKYCSICGGDLAETKESFTGIYPEFGVAGKSVWLPRRDDLQAMSGLGWERFDDKCFFLASQYLQSQGKECFADEIAKLVSKEQAGIMVVMQQLHDKSWNGTEWMNNK